MEIQNGLEKSIEIIAEHSENEVTKEMLDVIKNNSSGLEERKNKINNKELKILSRLTFKSYARKEK